MGSAWKQYTKEMANKFGYLATWEPGSPLKIGDIGIIKKNLFTRIGRLTDMRLDFDVREDKTTTQLSHVSSGAVSMTFKAAGKSTAPGSTLSESQAGVTIEFSKENATVFEAHNCTSSSIEDQIALGQSILQLYSQGAWNKAWVVVTELIHAESGTVLISAAKNAKIELSAKTADEGASFNLGDASVGLTIQYMTDMQTKIIAVEGQSLTPLFKARGVKGSAPLNSYLAAARVSVTDLVAPTDAVAKLYFGNVDFEHLPSSDSTESSE